MQHHNHHGDQHRSRMLNATVAQQHLHRRSNRRQIVRYTSGFICASAAAHLSQQRSNGSNTVHASSNARYTLATHTPTRTRRHTATLHATCLVAHRRSVPFRGIEPQTIAKTRKDTQRPANMCQRYAKTRKDMQSECAKLSHEHANIISILL